MLINKRRAGLLLAAILTFSAATAYGAPYDQEEQNLVEAANSMRASGHVQLNFDGVDIVRFLRFMSELLGENILVDPSIEGTVSVVSPKPVTLDEAREVMLSILEMNGLTLEQMDGYAKILPISGRGGTTGNAVVKSGMAVPPSETVLVQVVPLDNVNAGLVIGPLRTAIRDIQVAPIGSGDSVLLTGKGSLLNRAVSIIQALDSPDSVHLTKVLSLTHANPRQLEAQVNAMGQEPTSKLAGMKAFADERTRSIVLVGTASALKEGEEIILSLDVPSRAESFHVYRLEHSNAETVAEQLSSILSAAAKISPDPDGIVATVVPDLPTNSLIFTATQEQYASLVEILKQLDVQPKQVMLRGLIAEVSLNKLNSAGIDWAAWGGDLMGDAVIAGNVQLGSTGVPSDVQQLYQSLMTEEELVDRNGSTYSVTNTQGAGLMYAYIRLLNQFDAINVLSMPRLLCTDNLESSLQVGQVIPTLTGSMANQTSSGSITNSYEYKDVGLILNVTPHIRSGNLVALDIEQRIEELQTTTNNNTPITSKREVKTTVLVANGQTVIIGGLIREAEKVLKNRVPFFSYIPLIGNLFKSTEKQREKVDLMVFLTPYIIETPEHASQVTNTIIRDGQQLSDAEKILIQRNNADYKIATSREGVTPEMLDPKGRIFAPEAEESADGDAQASAEQESAEDDSQVLTEQASADDSAHAPAERDVDEWLRGEYERLAREGRI